MRRKTQDRRTDDEGQKHETNDDSVDRQLEDRNRNQDNAVDRQLEDRNDETKTMRSTGNWRTETTKPTMMRSTGRRR